MNNLFGDTYTGYKNYEKEGDFTVTVWKQLKYWQKGVSHVQNDTNCQDSVLIYENEDCIVAALADGLGSLKYSEVAAQTATETVCKCFSELNNPLKQFETKQDLAKYILDAAVMNIQDKAIEMDVPLNEMDCTLMFVCVLKSANYAIIGRLGDSAVCVIADPKSIAINDGNKSANGTNAILDKDAVEHFDIQSIDLNKNNVYGFILSSDGLENELYMKGSDHVNKAAELYFNAWFSSDDPTSVIAERISKLTEIEGTPFDDDISVAVLSRADEEIILPSDPKWLCTCGFRNHLQTTYCQQCHKDFSVLYQNIRFRDYGGKAAFFTEINKNPEEEMRIIGLKARDHLVMAEIPTKKDDLQKVPKAKAVSDTAKEPIGVISHNGTKNVPQTEKVKSAKVQYPVGIEAPIKKNVGYEVDIDSRKKSQTKASTVAGAADPLLGSSLQKEPIEGKKQPAIPAKQAISKKTGLPISDDVTGKKKQKNSPPHDAEIEIPQKQNSGKHASKTRKHQYNMERLKMLGILMSIVLVIGLVAGGVFVKNITAGKVNKLSESVDELTEKVKQYEVELAEKEMQPVVLLPEDFSVLEDGAYYWGTVDDFKLPHGFGILEKDDNYYIGNFEHGLKNGEFSVVDRDNGCKVENYYQNEVVPDKDDEDEVHTEDEIDLTLPFSSTQNLQKCETQQLANLRKMPGKDNDLIIQLSVGTIVYLLDTTEEEADDLSWIHVRTEEGNEGWIISEAIKR